MTDWATRPCKRCYGGTESATGFGDIFTCDKCDRKACTPGPVQQPSMEPESEHKQFIKARERLNRAHSLWKIGAMNTAEYEKEVEAFDNFVNELSAIDIATIVFRFPIRSIRSYRWLEDKQLVEYQVSVSDAYVAPNKKAQAINPGQHRLLYPYSTLTTAKPSCTRTVPSEQAHHRVEDSSLETS